MKGLSTLVLLAGLAASTTAWAVGGFKGEEILGPGLDSGRTEYFQNWDRTLDPDTLYTLTGLYYVTDSHTITIPAGCFVQADTAATLIIQRGGQIMATGSASDPIVFTSMKPAGERARGDWGGVVLLGRAPVNKVDPLIEGGIISGTYGGNEPEDSSGIFRYVRIEFPGYRFQLNNEINGLTMGGVGRGTELHHIQVSYSFDDAYEWFGGTVNANYLVAFGTTDDHFDTDFGYRGRLQFGFGLNDPGVWDPTGETRGMESDNDGSSSSTDEPFTHPYLVNFTIVGPKRTNDTLVPPTTSADYSAVTRRSSQSSLYNSVIMGWPWGLSLRDAITQQWALDDTLQWRNVSISALIEKVTGSNSVHGEDRWDQVTTWFNTPEYNNIGSEPRLPDDIGLTDMSDLNNPNPVPAAGSELIGSADFTNPRLAGFQVVTYRGAFDPELDMSQQWTAGWTNFDPQNTYYPVPVFDEDGNEVPSHVKLASSYPNPFNPSTVIKFSVPVKGPVTLTVYDVRGNVVAAIVDEVMSMGTFERTFDGSTLSSGTYFYRLQGNGFSETGKMQLVK